MRLLIFGAGYVGYAYALYFSKNFDVEIYDPDEDKVKKINNKLFLFSDSELKVARKYNIDHSHLSAKSDLNEIEGDFDVAIIATPTDYDDELNNFDTDSVIKSLIYIKNNLRCPVIIKSTVPYGFCEKITKKLDLKNVIFSPEFLREGSSVYDLFNPSRIIFGYNKEIPSKILKLFSNYNIDKEYIITMGYCEAESVKLFSNTFLAMRVSYFNELDSFCFEKSINVADVIKGVCMDNRIGDYYNNPSFGYGGYCLPKDTKQMLSNFDTIPQSIISAIVNSNATRKEFITNKIIDKNPKTVGIYKLAMKAGSDNYRASSIIDIIKGILNHNIRCIIYEPLINDDVFMGCSVIQNFKNFEEESDLIISNRFDNNIPKNHHKVFSRDISSRD